MNGDETPSLQMRPVATESTALAAAPVVVSDRIATLDVIRGVAVLGILLINIAGFGLAWAGTVSPMDVGIHSFADIAVFAAMNVFFEGTMRGLFSLLFGAGVILLTTRIEQRSGRACRVHYVRNLWLILFGLIHAYVLLWPGDILYFYGLAALLLYPARKLRPRTLIMIALVLMLGMVALNLWTRSKAIDLEQRATEARAIVNEGGVIDEDQEDAITEWRASTVMNVTELHEQRDAMRSGWFTILRYQYPQTKYGHTIEGVKWTLWDATSFMLIGMALMKLGVMSGLRSIGFYCGLMFVSYIVGIAVNAYELVHAFSHEFHPVAMETSFLTYDVGRLAVTLGHLSAVVLFVRSGLFKFLARMLAATGRMALTNYIMQTVICTLIFYGYGFGMYDRWTHSELWLVVVCIWVFQLIASPIWLRFFRFGPLEWLWRSLTYWKLQPMRNRAADIH